MGWQTLVPGRDGSQTARRRVIVVGFGTRGRQWVDACRRARHDVVCVVDPDPAAERAARAARLTWHESLPAALDVMSADAAIIASPPGSHFGDAFICVERGLAVLLEKPATLGVEPALLLLDAVKSNGTSVLVGQNFRFLPRECAVRAALLTGAVGRVVSTSIVSARPAGVAAPHLAAVRNAPLWDFVIHHVDTLRARFGDPAIVDASTSPKGDGGREEHVLRVTWPTGIVCALRHVEGAPSFHHHEWIEGTTASLLIDDGRVFLQRPNARRRNVRIQVRRSPEQALLDELTRTIAGAPSALSLASNLGTLATIEAAELSLARDQPVALDRRGWTATS